MRLTVENYNARNDYYLCRDENGYQHRVDLLVDGGIQPPPNPRASLIGKTVACKYLHPDIEIAMGVSLETTDCGGSEYRAEKQNAL